MYVELIFCNEGFYRNHHDNFGFEKTFLQSLKQKSVTTRMKKHLHEYIKIIIMGNLRNTPHHIIKVY